MLGCSEQAKAAQFYICPYLDKDNVPPAECLAMFNAAKQHVERHPSVAEDTDSDLKEQQSISSPDH